MAEKKYLVVLTKAEREYLETTINRDKHSSQKRKRVQPLLVGNQGYTDEGIVGWVGMHRRRIEGIRQ